MNVNVMHCQKTQMGFIRKLSVQELSESETGRTVSINKLLSISKQNMPAQFLKIPSYHITVTKRKSFHKNRLVKSVHLHTSKRLRVGDVLRFLKLSPRHLLRLHLTSYPNVDLGIFLNSFVDMFIDDRTGTLDLSI